MSKIKQIWAREILDSRAIPSVEAACVLDTGEIAVSSVPSGSSTGSYEALELRDGDSERYLGKGVLKAIDNVNKILGPAVVDMDPDNQEEIDKKIISLDGTENKSKLGANSILAVSQVVLKAASLANKTSLYQWVATLSQKFGLTSELSIPTPIFNMINGGLHGAGNLDFQEFFVIPMSSKSYTEGLQLGAEIYITLGQNLARRGAIHSVGDEGGFAPNLFTNADALEIIVEVVKQTKYSLGQDLLLGLDLAASTFYKDGSYHIRDKSSPLDEAGLIEYYKSLNDIYHLSILEDPLHEDAWDGWKKVVEIMGAQTLVVGDDLLVTNSKRVDKAIGEKTCNAILVKPNQIGTITETLAVIKKAKEAGWKIIVSHRSGETNDWLIADFAVGVGADFVKFGAPCRGERLAKYNRLSAVESELRVSR